MTNYSYFRLQLSLIFMMSRKANQHGYQDHLEFQNRDWFRVKQKIAVLKS